ncbi:hypothetical protein BDV18DRAFT_161517 [Aspergillus unguis]
MGSMAEQKYRIGVDVGGTNTDAVLLSLTSMSIITSTKSPTTADVTTGITLAIKTVISTANVSLESIACVIIGTTHFVNAVVQRSASLVPVSVLRLCGGSEQGFGRGVPPFIDFPADLKGWIEEKSYFLHGGFQISGEEISPLDENEIRAVGRELVQNGVENVVVSGMYAPLNHRQEVAVRDILLETMERTNTGKKFNPRITLSHEISGLGFLSRENASILNATLRPLAEKTIRGFKRAMRDIFGQTPCTLYLTQNDGSVLSAEEALTKPIRTFNSGPTNSIRGGEFLWRAAEGSTAEKRQERTEPLVVIDIGGTTSDAGLLLPNGLPQMSSITGIVGGVRTNFALPAVESIGLGGGSIIRHEHSVGFPTVGPDSVGLELLQKARLFGGDVLTATDIVALDGHRHQHESHPFKGLGDISRLSNITPHIIFVARGIMRSMISALVDRTKTQKGDVDVLIVGGGAPLIRTEQGLDGVRSLRTVQGAEVANAVGAAISRVSGVVDTVVDTSNQTVKKAQEIVCDLAIEKAVSNGSRRETVSIKEVTMLPIQYVDAKARIVVRAVGELDAIPGGEDVESEIENEEENEQEEKTTRKSIPSSTTPEINLETYRPKIENNEWLLTPTDLHLIALGCKILGCGGGGDPYQEYLKTSSLLSKSPGSIRVVSPSHLPPDSLIGWTGNMGSPEVSMERLENDECLKAHNELMRATESPAVAGFVALEIGGGNGLVNLGVAAKLGVVAVDADFMGRAYPTAWQVTPNVYGTEQGEALVPMTIASGDGSFVTMTRSRTDRLVDKILRASCVEMGCRAGSAGAPKTAGVVREQAVTNTISLAWWIGRAISLEKTIGERARRVIDEVGGPESARVLGEGKVVNVERVLKTGHTYGVLEIDGHLPDGTPAVLNVPFKNENAYVEARLKNGEKKMLASVPDLIAVLDAETGAGLGTPEYKYGLRVLILAIAASPRWTDTKRGMEVGGPASMGFDEVEYVPIGKYSQPRSVIEAFT